MKNSVAILDILEYAKNIMEYKHREARVMITKELMGICNPYLFKSAIIYDVIYDKVNETVILKEFTDFVGVKEDFQVIINI
jgi:hypothetical protein